MALYLSMLCSSLLYLIVKLQCCEFKTILFDVWQTSNILCRYVERSGRVVKVADFGSTGHGFKSTLAPLVTCVRASLNKFFL